MNRWCSWPIHHIMFLWYIWSIILFLDQSWRVNFCEPGMLEHFCQVQVLPKPFVSLLFQKLPQYVTYIVYLPLLLSPLHYLILQVHAFPWSAIELVRSISCSSFDVYFDGRMEVSQWSSRKSKYLIPTSLTCDRDLNLQSSQVTSILACHRTS